MEVKHFIYRHSSDGEKDLLVMRYDGFVTWNITSIARMYNFRRNVDLGELVLGLI